ncbi:hypothetical protein HDU88_003177 [Geranomyces variabilis]|nr:hypothetical protein HDU88_003177 [Geranomyces variabilis]
MPFACFRVLPKVDHGPKQLSKAASTVKSSFPTSTVKTPLNLYAGSFKNPFSIGTHLNWQTIKRNQTFTTEGLCRFTKFIEKAMGILAKVKLKGGGFAHGI